MVRRQIYLASPLGFAESTRGFMDGLVDALEQVVDVENPWSDLRFVDEIASIERLDSVIHRRERLQLVNQELGRSNAARIDASDGVCAVLDGVDVDSGTAAEIGYAFARGKYIFGLRTDFRLAGDNEAAIVNLQVQWFIEASGGKVVTSVPDFVRLAREFSGRGRTPTP